MSKHIAERFIAWYYAEGDAKRPRDDAVRVWFDAQPELDHTTAIDEALGEVYDFASTLKHPDDAIVNWDHPGNDKRAKFYQSHVAHAWVQAGKHIAKEIDRRRKALRGERDG